MSAPDDQSRVESKPARAFWVKTGVVDSRAVAAFVEVLWPVVRHLYSNGKVDCKAIAWRKPGTKEARVGFGDKAEFSQAVDKAFCIQAGVKGSSNRDVGKAILTQAERQNHLNPSLLRLKPMTKPSQIKPRMTRAGDKAISTGRWQK